VTNGCDEQHFLSVSYFPGSNHSYYASGEKLALFSTSGLCFICEILYYIMGSNVGRVAQSV